MWLQFWICAFHGWALTILNLINILKRFPVRVIWDEFPGYRNVWIHVLNSEFQFQFRQHRVLYNKCWYPWFNFQIKHGRCKIWNEETSCYNFQQISVKYAQIDIAHISLSDKTWWVVQTFRVKKLYFILNV